MSILEKPSKILTKVIVVPKCVSDQQLRPWSDHGFSFMDKQLLLTAVRFTQCRLVPYIANTVLYWQHFPDSSLLSRAAALNMGSHI